MENVPVKSEFGATATCFVNFSDFCEISFFLKTLFDVTMSLISKNGSGGAGQKRIWSHGGLFRELFWFLWNFQIFKTSKKRHHELNLEKRDRGSRSKANLVPRRPVSWTFSIFVIFCFCLACCLCVHVPTTFCSFPRWLGHPTKWQLPFCFDL